MDEDTLRSLWDSTFAGVDPASADPEATYKPPGGDGPAPSLSLPTFAVTGEPAAAPPSDVGESTTIDSGERSPLEDVPLGPDSVQDESEVPTLYTPPPLSGIEPTLVTPPPAGEGGVATPAPAGGGSYEIQEVIGVGGMGVVYRAQQLSLGREVAIKKMKPARGGGRWTRKFIGEAHVTGRLTHPNIVPVYDLGLSPSGEALIAMKLVDGVTWKRLLHPRSDEEKARAEGVELVDHLRIFDAVCNAVAFAHSRDVIHNDLKPENILLGEFGEVLVMDWGLALDVRSDPDPEGRLPHKTELKGPCGTPAYMAPELACADIDRIGPATDIYLLGSILHELVVGKPPHRGETVREIISRAAKSQPSTFGNDVPTELRDACWKAMARDPAERFASVRELQEAVREYLTHRESRTIEASARASLTQARGLVAKGETDEALYEAFASAIAGFEQARVLWEGNAEAEIGQWEARLAYAEAALSRGDLGLAATQASALGGAGEAQQAQRRLIVARVERAVHERAEAERSAAFVRRALLAATVVIFLGLALGTVLINAERSRAEANAERAERQRERADAERERAEGERLKARLRLAEALVAQGDTLGPARRWGEARAHYAEARAAFKEVGRDTLAAELGLLDADHNSPRPLVTTPGAHAGGANGVAFLPGGRSFVSVGADGLRLVDAETGAVRATRTDVGAQRDVAVSPDGLRLATATGEGRIELWSLPDLEPVATLEGHDGPVNRVVYSPAGRRLLSGGDDGTVRWWDPQSGELLHTYTEHDGPVVDVVFREEVYAYSITAAGQLIWWNVIEPPGSVHGRYERDVASGAQALAFRSWQHVDDLPQLVLARPDHGIAVWDHVMYRGDRLFNDFQETHRLAGHTAPASALAYSPDGARLLSGGLDGHLVLWGVTPARRIKKEAPRRPIGEPRPRFPKPEVVEQTESALREVLNIAHPGGAVRDVAISDDGRRIAAAGQDGRVRVWDVGLDRLNPTGAERAREVLAFAVDEADDFTCAALSPDGMLAAAGTAAGPVTLWDRTSGLPLARLDWHGTPVVYVAFRAGGEQLLTVGRGGQARLWALDGLQPLASLEVGAEISSADSAADRLAVGSDVPRTFEITPGGFQPGSSLAGYRPPMPVALSPDGSLLAVGQRDGGVAFWTQPGAQEQSVGATQHAGPTRALAFSPDSARFLSAGADGAVHLLRREGQRLEAEGSWRAHATEVTQLLFGPTGKVAFSAGADGSWRVWSLSEERALRTYEAQPGKVGGLGLSSAGEALLVAGKGALRLFDWSRPATYRASEGTDLADPVARGRWFAFRGELRAAVRALEEARRAGQSVPEATLMRCHWELGHHQAALRALTRGESSLPGYYVRLVREELTRLEELEGSRLGHEPDLVHALAFTADGRRALTSSDEGSIHVWDVESGERLLVLRAHARAWPDDRGGYPGVLSLTLSPDGRRFASGDRRGNVVLWDLDRGQLLRRRKFLKGGSINALAFTPDGRELLVGGYGKTLLVWNLEDDGLRSAEVTGRSIQCLAVAPDGKTVATSESDGTVRVLELESLREVVSWQADRSGVQGLSYRKDGAELVAACPRDKALRVFDPKNGEVLREFEGQWDSVYGFAITPDGARAATAGGGGGVKVIDLDAGREVAAFDQRRTLLSVALTPDGRRLLLGGRDGTLTLLTLSD